MLVLSLKNGNDDPARVSFRKILHSIGRNQPFDSIIDNKPFFWSTSNKEQDAYEKIYTTRTLLDYLHHQNDYQLIGIYLWRQMFLRKLISQKN